MSKNERTQGAGSLLVALALLIAWALPTFSTAEENETPANNHFKCYQILDWTEFTPKKAELKDQFGESIARILEPRLLCNPVDKNGEGIADREYHLVCYEMQDDPQGNVPRVKEVMIRNQFQEGPLWVGSSPMICVPSQKRYEPGG